MESPFFFQGCVGTIEEKIVNEIKKEQNFKKNLLDNNSAEDFVMDIEYMKSRDIIEEGDEIPLWAQKVRPKECGQEYYCGTARRGSLSGNECPHKFYCVEKNQLSAKSDMSYRIETILKTRQSDYAFSERDNKEENVFSQYEEETRAKGAPRSLKGVFFRHYYWLPEKVLLTFAMMKNPDYKIELDEESEAEGKIPNLYISLSVQNNDNFEVDEITKISEVRLNGILDKKNFVLLNQGKIHPYSMEQGSAIDKQMASIAEKYPDSFFLHLSLNGEIMQYSGNMFPSITILYMSFSAYSPEGQIIWKKTYEAKKLNIKKVSKLNTSEKRLSIIQTLEKGFNEIREKEIFSELESSS